MSRQWRSAVVGMGVIGEAHARVLSKIPEVQLVAVCDGLEDKARESLARQKLAHVSVYTDQRTMMAKEKIDVVHVCTPSGDHLSPGLIAMEAGANVICEKPLEITLHRIDQMLETAKKHGVRIAGIFQTRWDESNRAIKNAIVEGRFGTLAWAGAMRPGFRGAEYFSAARWRGTWKYDGGGAMMNQSIHGVDLLQWFLGPVKQVSAFASNRIHPNIEVEDTLSCSLEFVSGAVGSIMGSTAMYPGAPFRLEIGGEKGTAVWEGGLRRFAFVDQRQEDKELLARLDPSKPRGVDDNELHGKNIQAILHAWAQGNEAPTSGHESRKAVAIILAMYESAKRRGLPVEIQPA